MSYLGLAQSNRAKWEAMKLYIKLVVELMTRILQ